MLDQPRPNRSRGQRPVGLKRFRIDEGSGGGSEPAPGRGSLLRAFGRQAARAFVAPMPERRESPRHQVECQAWVGWKGWRRFYMNDALLVNLSRGGALIFVDAPPPRNRPVWVFLETPGRHTIVKARVSAIETTPQGQCSIRVAFEEPCPYVFFEAAVCGLAPTDPKLRLAPRARAKAGMPFHNTAG